MVLVAGYLLLIPFTLTHSQAVFAYSSDPRRCAGRRLIAYGTPIFLVRVWVLLDLDTVDC